MFLRPTFRHFYYSTEQGDFGRKNNDAARIGISTNSGRIFWAFRRFFSFDLPVHGRGARLVGRLAEVDDLDLQRALPKGDLDHVADFYLIARLDRAAVDADALGSAGVVGDRAPLDEPGNL